MSDGRVGYRCVGPAGLVRMGDSDQLPQASFAMKARPAVVLLFVFTNSSALARRSAVSCAVEQISQSLKLGCDRARAV